MIPRIAQYKLLDLSAKFKAVAIIGPRQTGKTTLVKTLFNQKPYVSLENPDDRSFALEDPRAFLEKYPKGAGNSLNTSHITTGLVEAKKPGFFMGVMIRS